MSWAWRALSGPILWALAFSGIYALHGIGCARNWPTQPGLLLDLHRSVLIGSWLFSLAVAAILLAGAPKGEGTEQSIVRIGGWIGFTATALTLFPVLGLTSC